MTEQSPPPPKVFGMFCETGKFDAKGQQLPSTPPADEEIPLFPEASSKEPK